MRRALEVNTGCGGMKRVMEEVAAQHTETVHYSASVGIWVGGDRSVDSEFWPLVLGGLSGVRLRKEEANLVEKRVQEVTGWSDPVEEKTGFVEAACQNYEVLVEDKRAGKAGETGPSKWYETRSGPGKNDSGSSGP